MLNQDDSGPVRPSGRKGGQAEQLRLELPKTTAGTTSELTFGELVARYINSGSIGQKTIARKKAKATVYVIRHNLEAYCLPYWRDVSVCEIRPRALEEWLLRLHDSSGLAWPTVGKVKQAMQGVFKFGRKEQFLSANLDLFQDIDCEASSDYEAITCTPDQTLRILNQLKEPEFVLTLLIAATGLSISEALGLQWSDVEYCRNRIVVRRSWVSEVGNCKNGHRKAPIAMHPVLAGYLRRWQETTKFGKPTDWVFASVKLEGTKPRCGSIASQRHLYPAAVKAGVIRSVEERDGNGKLTSVRYYELSGNPVRRWGWHNLRHSLASWLVSNGVDVSTVSSMLRHSNIRSTLGVYTHAFESDRLDAQGLFLERLLHNESAQSVDQKWSLSSAARRRESVSRVTAV
jgi:integrase